MKHIATINLEDCTKSELTNFKNREAVRAVIADNDGLIALVYVGCDDFYKIPGGGVDEGEGVMTALRRECFEEAGVEISNIKEFGVTMEYRKVWNQLQKSHCYTATVKGEKNLPEFTDWEIEKQFQISWVEPIIALEKMKTYKPEGLGE